MTTLEPRSPYTSEEISQLYPKNLQLQLVHVVSIYLSDQVARRIHSLCWPFDDVDDVDAVADVHLLSYSAMVCVD